MGDMNGEGIASGDGASELLNLDWFDLLTQSSGDSPETLESQQSPDSSTTPPERRSPPPPMLPPCRICGEKASGFHYGANTCEACKGFFRRCLNRKDRYKCIGSGCCEITPGKRSVCSYCRWKKCIDAGMSKSAIKTGRYTHEKKTRDIKEVKRLQHVEKLKAEGRYTEDLVDLHDSSELERIVKHITDVHKQHTPHTPEFFAKLPQKEKEFLEQRELQQKMFGTMRPIPREEYMQIYQTTGIDVDGRREMIKHMIPCIEKSIKRFIAFAKALPGFKELPIDDQIALIKGGRAECWHIWHHPAFNVKHSFITAPNGVIIGAREMEAICMLPHNINRKFRNAALMQSLELTYEETVLVGAMSVLAPDRVSAESRALVENAQWQLARALCRLLRQNHHRPAIIFGQCVRVLTQERSISYDVKFEEQRFRMDWKDKMEVPQLLFELWD